MSWSETLLDATFRGVPLQVTEESLQAERALSVHGVPYRDGDDVEDLGRGARDFSFAVVFFGTNYEIQLQLLLAALDMAGPGELIHPIYGPVPVVTQGWKVRHSADRPDYAAVELQFKEHTPGASFFARQFEFVDEGVLLADDEPSWQDGLLDLFGQVDALMATVQQWLGGGWVGLLENVLGLPGIGLRLAQLRSQIGGVLAALLDLSGSSKSASNFDPLLDLPRTPIEIRAAIANLTDPVREPGNVQEGQRSLLSQATLPTTMPGAALLDAQAARTATAFMLAAHQGQAPTAADIESVPQGLLESGDADPLQATAWGMVVLVMTELALAESAAVVTVLDAQRSTPTLSPDELERLVGSARGLAQAAIILHRQLYGVEHALRIIEPLRAISALVLATARQVALQRPPLVERAVDSDACLRLLAHRWYGDHGRALELLRLNPRLRSPYYIRQGEVLRAYAN